MSIHELRGKEVEPGGSGFIEMLEARQRGVDSLLCVGLDPVIDNIPDSFRNSWQLVHMSTQAERNAAVLARFNYKIIDATAPYVSTYKPNSAFYERYGIAGLNALKSTIDHIKSAYPTIPVILDAKRADIGNTNKGYAEMLQTIGADAITVNPYFGIEGKGALDPFLELGEKGIIVLCRTSNPEAVKMQDVIVMDEVLGEVPYYMRVARMAEEARQKNSNVAIVVGATVPDQLRAVRGIFKGIILVPGLGKQGGRPEDLVGAFDERGLGIIANNASAIIHASKEEDFVGAAARAALDWRNSINEARKLPRREMDVVREDRVKQILAETGAVITGSHFVYASGLHGEAYVNKDAVYSNPRNIRELCRMMANDFRREGVEVVVGPVAGGVALSMETALALGVEAAYADKTEDGGYILKRGFDKKIKGKKVLITEDILTTGGTVLKVIEAVKAAGGEVIGIAAICNRGGVTSDTLEGIPVKPLLSVRFEAWNEEDCGLCISGVPVRTDLGKGAAFLASKQMPPHGGR